MRFQKDTPSFILPRLHDFCEPTVGSSLPNPRITLNGRNIAYRTDPCSLDSLPSLTIHIRHLRAWLVRNCTSRKLRVAICCILLHREASEVDSDAGVVRGAVRQTPKQGIRNSSLEILSARRARASHILVAADEVAISKVI